MTSASAWKDGTVLLLRDSNAIVSAVTDSRISHVALVFNVNDSAVVFEATPGKVRQLALASYLREITVINERRRKPMSVLAAVPRRDYDEDQLKEMRKFAQARIGQRYSVKGYVRDKPGSGVHCSEFAARTLAHSRRHSFRAPHQVTPVRLTNLLLFTHRSPVAVTLPTRPKSSWCDRTSECWDDFWNWCGWACVETMSFCF